MSETLADPEAVVEDSSTSATEVTELGTAVVHVSTVHGLDLMQYVVAIINSVKTLMSSL